MSFRKNNNFIRADFVSFRWLTTSFFHCLSYCFLSRLILGAGIGLINAKAINLISEHYSGSERSKMLGYRGSAEVLGSAIFTMISGFLVSFGWDKAFLIYLFALLILILFLTIVARMPEPSKNVSKLNSENNEKMTKSQLMYLSGMAFYAGFLILVNTAVTLRIPVVIEELGLGNPQESSLILSLMMLMGIVSGFFFNCALRKLGHYFMSVIAFLIGLGMLILWQGYSLTGITVGALIIGLVYSLGVTKVFYTISEKMTTQQLTTATTLILIGCNIGGGGSALVLQLIWQIKANNLFAYLVFGCLSLLLAGFLFIQTQRSILKSSQKRQ